MTPSRGSKTTILPSACPTSIRSALEILWRAVQYAEDVDYSRWDFAVEINHLCKLGLTEVDLRWLVCKGYAEHAREVTLDGQDRRRFCTQGDLTFGPKTCFVLTELGANVAPNLISATEVAQVDSEEFELRSSKQVVAAAPYWDRNRRELSYGDDLVKRFRLPSPNQELVLTSFQEDGWPCRIDDLLPPVSESDPKRRLRDTINSLNRHQKNCILRFLGDGTGEGVIWESVDSSSR